MKTRYLFPVILLISSFATARTWQVELDGSADFTNIQPAVEASADGDTILIGAGRFDQTFLYHASGWSDQVVVGIDDKDLTLIGSGRDVTIIGPSVRDSMRWPGPIGIMINLGSEIRIESLTTENLSGGVYFWSDHLEMYNCILRNHCVALSTWGTTGTLLNECRFEGSEYGILGGSRGNGLTILNCEFFGSTLYHISLQYIEGVIIDSCQFYSATVAVQFDGDDCYGTIRNSIVHTGFGPHFASISGAQMELVDNILHGGNKQLQISFGTITGHGNVLHGTDRPGGGFATIYCAGGHLEFNNNHIMRGNAQHLILAEYFIQPETIILNLENNWWGTTDVVSLALWMHDINDDPSNHVVIDYSPYQGGPVSNEDMSFGEIKAMFRR